MGMSATTYNAHANQITYAGYCALGGASNPRLMSRDVYLGKHYTFTEYYLLPY